MHQCRNFDQIRDWAISQKPVTTGLLVHPQLGPIESGELNRSALPVDEESYLQALQYSSKALWGRV